MPRAARMGACDCDRGGPLLNHALVIYSCDQQLPECRTCRSPDSKGSSPCPRRASHTLVNSGFFPCSHKKLMLACSFRGQGSAKINEENRLRSLSKPYWQE